MKPGDIIYTLFPYEDRPEFKKRPAVVLRVNPPSFVCAKVTSCNKRTPWGVDILNWKSANLKKPSKICVSSLFTSSSRCCECLGQLSKKDLKKVERAFQKFLDTTQKNRRVAL